MINRYGLFLGALWLAALSGCVSEKAYDEVNQKLENERTKNEAVLSEMDLVKEENATLQKQITDLREAGGASLEAYQADKAKMSGLQATIDKQARQIKALAARKPAPAPPPEPPKPDLSWANGLIAGFKKSFPDELREGIVQAQIRGGRLEIRVAEKLLYEPDGVEITVGGEDVLTRVGEILSRVKNQTIEVGAHLDNTPIAPVMAREFPTAWDFTGARAVEAVRFLQEESKISGRILTAAAYGSEHPLVSNASEAGRTRNRRVEIIVSPAEGE